MANSRKRPNQRTQVGSRSEVWPEKMKLSQARKYLGVSVPKMSMLVRSGVLKFEKSPLDGRLRLVKRSDLEELKRQYAKD
jgi:excisionase family DNA binding protein